MTDEVTSLPWHHDPDREGCRETQDSVDENIDRLIDAEDEHGAEFYAGLLNWAIERLDYVPDRLQREIPEQAQELADEVADDLGYDEGQGTAEAWAGFAVEALHSARHAYENQHGESNTDNLAAIVSDIRDSWERTKNNGTEQ